MILYSVFNLKAPLFKGGWGGSDPIKQATFLLNPIKKQQFQGNVKEINSSIPPPITSTLQIEEDVGKVGVKGDRLVPGGKSDRPVWRL
ncbi:hypothetical protein [Cylindrospermopsis raciborskii]|uniref:hypothetical protein n=1 Tax=Cylindrospermopsis raciborskii TaxID=77022 RepID=UPI001177ED55|nr:hypothetical protein [Cylindrospermopsis raciborskii]